jgi:hypothetical protein
MSSIKIFSGLLLCIFFLGGWTQEINLKKYKVSKEITMLIPESFVAMSTSERIQKYVSNREPIAMFTSQDRNMDLGINTSSTQWSTGDIDILYDFYRASILNMYDEVEFHQSEVKTINGRTFIVFEFTSKVFGKNDSFRQNFTGKYNYIQYTPWQGKLILFNFSGPLRARQLWQEPVGKMMNSIKIKDQ